MVKRRSSKNPVPLIVEPHPSDYEGYPFITLIQYDKQHILTIVDNVTDKFIQAYVLDMCGPESIEEEHIVTIADAWFTQFKDRFPLSFEFSRRGVARKTSQIYKTFNIEFVSRVIGPLPRFDLKQPPKIRRRRRKNIPANVIVKSKMVELC